MSQPEKFMVEIRGAVPAVDANVMDWEGVCQMCFTPVVENGKLIAFDFAHVAYTLHCAERETDGAKHYHLTSVLIDQPEIGDAGENKE